MPIRQVKYFDLSKIYLHLVTFGAYNINYFLKLLLSTYFLFHGLSLACSQGDITQYVQENQPPTNNQRALANQSITIDQDNSPDSSNSGETKKRDTQQKPPEKKLQSRALLTQPESRRPGNWAKTKKNNNGKNREAGACQRAPSARKQKTIGGRAPPSTSSSSRSDHLLR
ncbi:hypothetical protein GWI33_014018 [Rhynchophorus ferrugineus]|uniref:Uncharacterized protein n=1 Tax=Rhynchophorus ferrugineus TaxID=354439 RepID=A0A834M9G7_RHYFE|nr:hypothetical protein GWI33_014018 [Rhynchophorus ferrugineus]